MLIVNAICIRSEIVECFSKKHLNIRAPNKSTRAGRRMQQRLGMQGGNFGGDLSAGAVHVPALLRQGQSDHVSTVDPPGLRLPRSGPVFPESGEQQLPGRRMSMCRWLPAVQETYLPWTC
ncbi:unnamed protein product [Callosobruchus maculatus]|uniref:Uncharacterized protein n=1 Tax=Callosobruchus maculatus TaxID=64391 RepID=A0A653CJ47_CALMS|nr:unnamed protein product [Callosobruchus maculatus]